MTCSILVKCESVYFPLAVFRRNSQEGVYETIASCNAHIRSSLLKGPIAFCQNAAVINPWSCLCEWLGLTVVVQSCVLRGHQTVSSTTWCSAPGYRSCLSTEIPITVHSIIKHNGPAVAERLSEWNTCKFLYAKTSISAFCSLFQDKPCSL